MFIFLYCLQKKTFSCNTRVAKHVESETRRKNILQNCPEKAKATEKECRRREFCHSWLENKRFKPWLMELPNDPFHCFCSFCNCSFRCGLDAVMRHSDTKKHISECRIRGFNFDFYTSDEESSLSFEDRKKIAEIKFAALIAEKNIPFQTAESILSFFQDLGKEPVVLQSMTMHRTRAPQIINKVLCVREQERLVDILRNSKFSVFIDETSDVSNDKWMTFLVRFVDPQTLDV